MALGTRSLNGSGPAACAAGDMNVAPRPAVTGVCVRTDRAWVAGFPPVEATRIANLCHTDCKPVQHGVGNAPDSPLKNSM